MSTLNFRHEQIPDAKQPFVYLKCGHVFGRVDWGEVEGEFRVTLFLKSLFIQYSPIQLTSLHSDVRFP